MKNCFNLFTLSFICYLIAACNEVSITDTLVQQAEYDRYSAIVSKDTTALNQLLAEEFIYNQPNGAVADRFTYVQNVAAGRPLIRNAAIDSLAVNSYDNFAVSTGIATIEAEIDGQNITASLRFTNTWIWRENRLQLVVRQSAFID